MAHGDYHCCSCCDRKLSYAGFDATAKEELCAECAVTLSEAAGARITTAEALVRWIQSEPPERVRAALATAGFELCYYANEVDDAAVAALTKAAFDGDGRLKPAAAGEGP